MPIRLSRQTRALLARATDALLCSLDAPSPAAWRESVRTAVRELLEADVVAFRLPPELSAPEREDELPPILDDAYRQAIRARHSALVLRTEQPDALLMAAEVERGSRRLAGLVCGRDPGRAPFRDSAVALMRLLYPAFRAGVAACAEVARREAGWQVALEGLTEGAALVDGAGRTLQRNHALLRLLATEPEAATIQVAADALAATLVQALAGGATGRGSRAFGGRPPRASGEVRTGEGCYRLFGTVLEPGARPGPGTRLLLVVEPCAQRLPDPISLRRRFGLSRREAEVALLLAQGGRNTQVAARLGISPHTARHHTEMVLAKLGIRSRAEVAAALGRP